MKYFFGICLWICSLSVWGQMITAPAPLTIEANASNVDAGDFVVNWANNTDQLLVSLSLDYHNGATLSFPTTTGLTKNYGYNSWTGVSSIVFYGTRDNINAGLAAMTISMGSVKTAVKINIEVSNYDASYIYNPTNKHYYKFISGAVTYTSAKSGATGQAAFKGKSAYLATITSQAENDFINNNISQNNIWVAISDAVTEGQWILDAGPEANTNIWNTNVAGITNTTYTSYAATGNTVSGQYTNWCTNEPNNSDGSRNGEDCAVAKSGGATCWNDLADGNSSGISGYLIEFSEDFPAGSSYTGVYATYAVHNNDIAFTLATANNTTLNSSTVSNYPNLFGGLQINTGNTVTLNSSTTLNTNKIIFNGTGKLVLTDNTSKWTPGTSNNLTNTLIHSPSINGTPTYWSTSSNFSGDVFYTNAPYPTVTTGYHFTPWLNSPQGWSAGSNDGNQNITLSYDVPTYITGIVTQGRTINGTQYVSNVNVDVSTDGTTWRRVLTGVNLNTNTTESVTTYFPNVEYAKFVKLMPTSAGWVNHITMKMGLLIKSSNMISDGLVLNLDAGNQTSFVGTGTTFKDLSTAGNNGTLTNGPTYNLPNRGYFTFDGVDDYVNGVAIPSTSGNSSRTVMVWYKSTANKNIVLLDKGAITVDNAEQLFITYTNGVGIGAGSYPPTNTGGIAVCFWGNDLIYPIASSTLFDGNWHFVAYTYDNSNTSVRICFDGNFATSVYQWNTSWTTNSSKPFVLPRSINTTNNPYWIGQTRAAYWGYGGTYSNVNIPMVQIYNRALTEAEILTNYNATRARYGR